MSIYQNVFGNDDLRRIIFNYFPKRCNSCHKIMNREFVNSFIHRYNNKIWRDTENKYCRNYCNWCCIYVFNHQY